MSCSTHILVYEIEHRTGANSTSTFNIQYNKSQITNHKSHSTQSHSIVILGKMSNEMVEMQKELRKNKGSLPGSDKHGGTDGSAASMYRLADKSGTKKAKIRSTFGVFVHAAGGAKTEVAACKACLAVYTFKTSMGTSSLRRHVCNQQTEKQEHIVRGQGIMNLHFRRGK